jgi:DnaJ-class molecular chaperone
MQPCKIGWCVSFAVPESEYCAVHKGKPQFTPTSVEVKAGLWTFEYEREVCDVCNGDGEHECSDSRCFVTHECGGCEGEGTRETFTATRADTLEVRGYDKEAFEKAFPEVDIKALMKGATA